MIKPDPHAGVDPAHEGCRVAVVRDGERGVVATRAFSEGDVVLTFRGPLLEKSQIDDFTYTIEVGDGYFIGPSGQTDDFVNHSCEPTCRVEIIGHVARLRAVRDIRPGDEINYDYSTLILRDPTTFDCHCGSRKCRTVVRPYHALSPQLRRAYRIKRMVPDFVLGAQEVLKRRD